MEVVRADLRGGLAHEHATAAGAASPNKPPTRRVIHIGRKRHAGTRVSND